MKQTIFRLFSLLLLGMVATGVQATPFKNIHIRLTPNDATAGTVYMLTEDSNHASETLSDGSVDVKATIGEDGKEKINGVDGEGLYECWLYADPKDGYELAGFTRVLKANIDDYLPEDFLVEALGGTDDHSEGFRVNVNCPRGTTEKPYDTKSDDGFNNDGDAARAAARAMNNWNSEPDHQFYAIFKPSTGPVNRVSVAYFQPWLSGMQDETFGKWTNEMINEGSKVKLTAIPAEGMRFVCWRNADGNELSKDKEYVVNNVTSTYKPDFDLALLTLKAELSTYSNSKQSRFDYENSGLSAYKVTAVNDKLTLVKVRHANAGEGVILQGETGKEYETSYTGLFLDEDNSDNLLKGTASGPVTANGKIYVLAKKNQGLGFYKLADNEEVPPNKAYLEIDDANNARDFFGFDDGTTTSISSVAEVEQPTPIYNMAGQRVSGSFSGLVIQNGRKYIRK